MPQEKSKPVKTGQLQSILLAVCLQIKFFETIAFIGQHLT